MICVYEIPAYIAHVCNAVMTQDYKHLALFWNDMIYLMTNKPQALSSTGPFRAIAANTKKISDELIDMNLKMADFNKYMTEYYAQMADTWSEAQKKVNLKAPDIPKDPEQLEAYKRIWIDIFDNDFTDLFDSEKFGANYGKMVSTELDMAKRWSNVVDVVLKSANLPNRQELDEVYREVHSLRKRIAHLEGRLNRETKNDD